MKKESSLFNTLKNWQKLCDLRELNCKKKKEKKKKKRTPNNEKMKELKITTISDLTLSWPRSLSYRNLSIDLL